MRRDQRWHVADIRRIRTGMTATAPRRQRYGTTLRCSCGVSFGKVSNEPPSGGGRAAARARHAEHVAEASS